MLTCVYSPIDPERYVEEEEADRLKATGVWFDCPNKAKKYRENVEQNIKQESKAGEIRPKVQQKGKLNER